MENRPGLIWTYPQRQYKNASIMSACIYLCMNGIDDGSAQQCWGAAELRPIDCLYSIYYRHDGETEQTEGAWMINSKKEAEKQ